MSSKTVVDLSEVAKDLPPVTEKTENTSGFRPVEFKVLVRPDEVAEKTSGGVIIPDTEHERMGWAQTKGTIIAHGSKAFADFAEDRDALVVGARIFFDKYTGIIFEGADGEEYRIIQDKEVAGIVTDDAAAPIIMGRNRRKLDGTA